MFQRTTHNFLILADDFFKYARAQRPGISLAPLVLQTSALRSFLGIKFLLCTREEQIGKEKLR
jgi:hypothetical protein